MHLDRVTEAIAHFIGLFEITAEEARLREAYHEFRAQKADNPELPDLPATATPFAAPHEFVGFEPGITYRAPGPQWIAVHPWTHLNFAPPEVPPFGPNEIATPTYSFPANFISGTSHRILLPEVETLGSFANYISQGISLSDNDYFGVGGHGWYFAPKPVGDSQLIALANAAADKSPIDDLEMPGSPDEVATFVMKAFDLLDALSEDAEGDPFVTKSPAEKTIVNGEEVEETPKLEDYHTFDKEPEEDIPANVQLTEDGAIIDESVSVEMGGNTLLNNAVVQNYWTSAPVMAVVGQYIELNAIIQINAWSDNDYITSAVGAWIHDPASTQAFNIATFERFGSFDDKGPSATADFPEHWVIKEIEGDLMMVNWLEQFVFMMDNDIGILSSSGVTTRVYSGDNQAYNTVSIEELGFGYDLIIVGGSVYDANIIQQMNVLSDNDLVGAVAGFQTSGDGSVSTAGNLLWNQAYIYNVGAADRFESMPAHYLESATKLAAGNDYLSDGVLSDSAFAGYGALRVLYIKGDLLNLQYVKQTNILGDSDQLALAMHAKDAYPDAEWSVTTGGNTLVNNAAILDLDSVGKTYVGNGHYSNEILVQADIISTEPEFGGQDPNVLVNEAVAFLDDDMMNADEQPYGTSGQFDADYLQSDGLQTLIG